MASALAKMGLNISDFRSLVHILRRWALAKMGFADFSTYAKCAIGAFGLAAFVKWWRDTRTGNLPPGAMGLPFIGETLEYVSDPKQFYATRFEKHGGTFKSKVHFKNVVCLAPTDANAKLFYSLPQVGWPSHWAKVVGETSLIFLPAGRIHKRIRIGNSRAFTDANLETYCSTFQDITIRHLDDWVASTQERGGAPHDMYFDMKRFAFELAHRNILGVDLPMDTTRYFMNLMDHIMTGIGILLPLDLPGLPWRGVLKSRRKLCEGYQKIVDQRRAELKAGAKTTSMLDSVLTAEGLDAPQSDAELHDFCIGMIFAGHDSTRASAQSLLYWLKEVPGLEAELRQEARAAWDGRSKITPAIFEKIPKIRAFLQEVWRITPVPPTLYRAVEKDTVVDGYMVPKGWTLLYQTLIQPAVPTPEEFRLDRCLDCDGKFVDNTFDRTTFNVFGGGARMCLGYKFARNEMYVFLVCLLCCYDFDLVDAKNQKFPFGCWSVTCGFRKLQQSKLEH